MENGSCEAYIILPNNKNIILAAEQVRKLLGASKISYVPTTNLAQGLAALLHFDGTRTLEENTVIMTKESKEAVGGAVTIAVRDSVVNGIKVHKGDYLGLLNDKIICTGTSIEEVLRQLLQDADYELVSMYYGEELSAEYAEALAGEIREIGGWEVEVFPGGQPLYQLLLAME